VRVTDLELRTPRLLLRPWRPDDEADVETALDIYRRDEVARWLGATPRPWPDLDHARTRLERWRSVSGETLGLGLWAVVPDDADHPVGTVLLVRLPGSGGVITDDVEIGWHFHPDAWGRGYATEAADALLAHGFTTLGLPCVNAVAHAGNAPSFAVMQRLGMTSQGTTDRWYDVGLEWWRIDRKGWSAAHDTVQQADGTA
jgi:RimJ/RimL family protein N-acetyltransferase